MKIELVDVAIMGGASMIAYGTWQIFQPAAFIVGGALIMGLAFAAARAPRGSSK